VGFKKVFFGLRCRVAHAVEVAVQVEAVKSLRAEKGIEALLKESGTNVVHNPQSNTNNAVGVADIIKMSALGIGFGVKFLSLYISTCFPGEISYCKASVMVSVFVIIKNSNAVDLN